jgi:hypothetical protein
MKRACIGVAYIIVYLTLSMQYYSNCSINSTPYIPVVLSVVPDVVVSVDSLVVTPLVVLSTV